MALPANNHPLSPVTKILGMEDREVLHINISITCNLSKKPLRFNHSETQGSLPAKNITFITDRLLYLILRTQTNVCFTDSQLIDRNLKIVKDSVNMVG